MTELTCQQCRELAAELALDVLTGRERAQALAHLDDCTSCRDTVSALTVTADRLIELLPNAQPPAGFEHRVMAALTPSSPGARRWRLAGAAVLLTITLATGGWILGLATHDVRPAQTNTQAENDAQAGERTVLYAPVTTGQDQTEQDQIGEHQIGHAYVYPGNPSWIYLSLATDSDTTSSTVRCEVIRRDGSTVPIGTFPLAHGHGTWGGPVPVDRNTLATARLRLINGNGHTLATAHFTSSATKSDHPTPRSHVGHRRHGHS
jgi:hypothetical protein